MLRSKANAGPARVGAELGQHRGRCPGKEDLSVERFTSHPFRSNWNGWGTGALVAEVPRPDPDFGGLPELWAARHCGCIKFSPIDCKWVIVGVEQPRLLCIFAEGLRGH